VMNGLSLGIKDPGFQGDEDAGFHWRAYDRL